MKYTWLIGSIGLSLVSGILLFAWQHEYLLIRFPQKIELTHQPPHTKKAVSLHYWKNNQWHTEQQEIIWTNDTAQKIQQLVSYWLRLVEENEIVTKHIVLQSVAISPTGQDIYISFNRNPLAKQWSIFQKWMFIEGLLRTIRSNSDPILTVSFLIHYKIMTDTHLDFSHSWPITGYHNASLQ